MRDAFHHVAITADGINAVVDQLVIRLIEMSGQPALSNRHADGVGDALSQRACRGFYAWSKAVFRVAGGFGIPLTKLLELRERKIVAGQMQQRVKQHGSVT